MSLTKVTNEVIGLSTITPDKLTQGGPNWSQFGGLSAVAFVGDGSGLTNVFPAVSVVEITNSFYTIRPEDNNFTLVFPQETYIDFQPPFDYQLGHKTALIQSGTGSIIVGGAQNVFGYDRTKGQYSKAFLQLANEFAGWTLYGDLTAQVLPDTSGNDGRATQLAAGSQDSFALAGNALYAVGYNNFGQLGLGDRTRRSTFTKLSGSWTAIVTQFGTGGQHAAALSGTDLYTTGGSDPSTYGALGVGDNNSRSTFTKVTVPTNAKWTSVDTGYLFSLALSGTDLYATGLNDFGQLGLGDVLSRSTFTKAVGNWNSIIASYGFSFVLSGTELYATGGNTYGQLGYGDTNHRSTFTKVPGNWNSLAAKANHALALSGTDLYVTGLGNNGALGLGDIIHRSTFTKVTVPANAKWTAIAAGANCSFALSGTDLYVVGANSGQFGLGDATHRSTFTKVPGNWSSIAATSQLVALSATGNGLFSTGLNSSGQLGLGDTANRSTFTRVSGVYIEYSAPALPQFTQIAGGDMYSLALSGTDLYVCSFGLSFGANTSTFTKVTGNWTSIAAGGIHCLALSGTDLYADGNNGKGQLGLNSIIGTGSLTKTLIPTGAKWTAIAAGTEHSLALSGTDLFAAGYNIYGSLGLGDTADRSTFTKVSIPTNAKWTAIAAGGDSSLALSGTDLYATGYNNNGKLGLGDASWRLTFTKVAGNWTAVAMGNGHSLALSGTDLYSTGTNSDGQLGLGTTVDVRTFTKVTVPNNAKWTAIAAGGAHSLALSGTDLYVVGDGQFGRIGLNDTNSRSVFTKVPGNWTVVAAGVYHSLALSGTSLFVTGYNFSGELGLNDRTNRSTFTPVTAVG